MLRATSSVALTILMLAAAAVLLVRPLPTHAAPGLQVVQMELGTCFSEWGPCSETVSFSSSVQAGDAIVVGVTVTAGAISSLTDTQHLLSSAKMTASDSYPDNAYVYYAASAAGGAESVTVSTPFEGGVAVDVFMFEVQGADLASATFATTNNGLACPSGSCTASFSTSSSAAFEPGAFLLGVMADSGEGTNFGPGDGFAAEIGYTNPSHWGESYAEYSPSSTTSVTSSPTDFPASISTVQNYHWAEIGLVLDPAATATATSLTCSPQSIWVGSSSTCTATVTGASPTGTVTFASSSSTGSFTPPSGRCTLSSSGSCSVSYGDASGGSPTIEASYSGDADNTASVGTFSLTVVGLPPQPTVFLPTVSVSSIGPSAAVSCPEPGSVCYSSTQNVTVSGMVWLPSWYTATSPTYLKYSVWDYDGGASHSADATISEEQQGTLCSPSSPGSKSIFSHLSRHLLQEASSSCTSITFWTFTFNATLASGLPYWMPTILTITIHSTPQPATSQTTSSENIFIWET